MKSPRYLRPRLRLIQGAFLLLLGLLTAGAATRQLLLDANNRPTAPVDFGGGNWTGTLAAARLPDSVPLLSGGVLSLPGALSAGTLSTSADVSVGGFFDAASRGQFHDGLSVSSSTYLDDGLICTNGSGSLQVDYGLTAAYLVVGGYLQIDASGTHYDSEGEPTLDGGGNASFASLSVSGPSFLDGGRISTDSNGTIYLGGGNTIIDVDGSAFFGGAVSVNGDLAANTVNCAAVVTPHGVLADADGNLRAGVDNAVVADPDGYLCTGSQPYHGGTVTPTGYLLLKDSTGTVYRIPAAGVPTP